MYKQRFGNRANNSRGGFRSPNNNPRFGGPSRGRNRGASINPNLFIRAALDVAPDEVVIENTFAGFPISSTLKQNVLNHGYNIPTPIQDKAIIPGLQGRDILGLADTGTGKTATFIIPILEHLSKYPNDNALIVAPTRELANQIREEMRILSANMHIFSCTLIGGADIHRQISELRRRPHVFIGTPGRLKDLKNRGILRLDQTRIVVLDEVDRMLDMGFVHDIREILSTVPEDRQTLLFSATIDAGVEAIANKFMRDPLKISVKTGATSQNVEQKIIKTGPDKTQKISVLCDLLSTEEITKVLVFGRTKHGVEKLSIDLARAGHSAGSIHGNKRQGQRERVLRDFKESRLRILVATDVAARGIDVKDISHVINFDQPGTYDDYVHRIGRTGRAGNKGFAITFVD
jgi:ATP-dependent RNA helicase RhlE